MSDATPDAPQQAAETPTPEGQPDGAAPPQPEAPREPNWVKDRVNVAVRQREEEARARALAEQRAEAAERTLADMRRQASGQPPQQDQPETPQQIEGRLRTEFQQREADARFGQRCVTLADAIKGAVGDAGLEQATQGFVDLGVDFRGRMAPEHRELIEDIAGMPNGAAVYHYLGTHRDEAHEIMAMTPRAQARALAEVGRRAEMPADGSAPALAPPRPVSSAPPPPGRQPPPLRASSRSVNDPGLSMEDFVAMRERKR